ncbi:MAG: amino acid permease [Parvularculaceae bacterium]
MGANEMHRIDDKPSKGDRPTGAGRSRLQKSVEEILDDSQKVGLERSIGPIALTLLGVGVIIGAGIFVLTGVAAAEFAGPAISLSFMLAAAGCAFAGLCYAEFAAMIPAPGSAYTYTYATLGELAAWFIGWNLLLEYTFAASYVAVGWSGYFGGLVQMFGVTLEGPLTAAPLGVVDGQLVLTGNFINLPAVAIILAVTFVACRGMTLSATLNAIIVALKLGVLGLFVGFGAFHMSADNLSPFIPENSGEFGHFGWSGVLRGAAVVFVAYLGFDAVSAVAQEVRNPQRNMPVGILLSLTICAVIYAAVAIVLTGLAPYETLNVSNPLSVALLSAGGALDWLAPLVDIAAVAGLASVMLVIILAQPRILLAMARDGLLPSGIGVVDERRRTPITATMITGVAVAILSGLFPIGILAQLVSLGALTVFTAVCIGVLVLRRARPDLSRPFRVPAVAIIAPMGALLCLYLLSGLPKQSWILYAVWASIGAVIYFVFGRRSANRVRAARRTATR